MNLGGSFDIELKRKSLRDLREKSESPKVWGDPSLLQKINQEISTLQKTIEEFDMISKKSEDALILLEMSQDEDDEGVFQEVKKEISDLENLLDKLETQKLLSGEMDLNSAFVSINSGAGGTEACDWADALLRMYTRFAESEGYKVDVIEMTEGEGAGIKSVTISVEGPYAYGYLKSETGVHRLVRISPFDSNARRHTSFASVFVWPEVDEDIEVDINEADVKVDTYRASGAGGQHINKTDSAIRMTHLPTGIVVQCQKERSQIANREKAMKMLKTTLYDLEVKKRQEEKDKQNSEKKLNEWGSQIRSYVLHPYKLVKDHRTGHESSQAEKILDGELQDFMQSYLKMIGNPS
jgi:peptide chain release factor 2